MFRAFLHVLGSEKSVWGWLYLQDMQGLMKEQLGRRCESSMGLKCHYKSSFRQLNYVSSQGLPT